LCLAAATALCVATPLVPSERPEVTGASLPLAMLWLLLAAVYFAGAALFRWPIRCGPTAWALLALIGWTAVSGLVMQWHGAFRPTINMVWTWVGYGATFFVLRQLLVEGLQTRAICAVMIGVAVCLSAIAIQQYFITMPQARERFQQNEEGVLREARINAPPGSPAREQFRSRLFSPEPTATFSLTNSLAAFLAPWLVLAVAAALPLLPLGEGRGEGLSQRARGKESSRYALAATCLLLAYCLYLTHSRTAGLATAIGIAAALVVHFALWRRARWLVLPACGFAALLVVLLVCSAIGVVQFAPLNNAAQSLLYRMEYWLSTDKIILDYPLFGVGPGNFQDYYQTYKQPQASETVADPHNFILEIWATAGTPAALLLFVLAAALAWQLRQRPGVDVAKPVDARTKNAAAKGNWPESLLAPLPVYTGLIAGLLLALPLCLVCGFSLPGGLWLGGTMAVLAVALLHPWATRGAMECWPVLIAMGVLLLTLLASGGIGFPGVAITLWVLLAAALVPAAPPRAAARWAHPFAGYSTCAAALALLLGCYFTAYRPVLDASRLLDQASDLLAAGKVEAAAQRFEQAAAADPYSATPRLQLALLEYERWFTTPADKRTPAMFAQFEQSAQQALSLGKRDYVALEQIAWCYLEAYGQRADRRDWQQASNLLEAAARLAPHEAMAHAQLAWTWRQGPAAAHERAQAAAERALELDRQCPHGERKLAKRRLFVESMTPAQQARLEASLERSAEQWMQEIRKAQR
jgi:hypothetical protein